MTKKRLGILGALVFTFILAIPVQATEAPKTVTQSELGTYDGYDYELWSDSDQTGTVSMTLNGGGSFSCNWSDINNALFRTGLKFDKTKTHEELGEIALNYECDYNPNGNSYLSVYGWTTEPLIEFYVIESWGSWRPPGGTSKGTITVDGDTYEVYETTRTEQPSIEGTATFQQFWSVRTEKRTSGTIPISEHFKAWQEMGMEMGKMYEVALVVEGYQSSGTADVLSNVITIDGVEAVSNTTGDTLGDDVVNDVAGDTSDDDVTNDVTDNVGYSTSDAASGTNDVASGTNDIASDINDGNTDESTVSENSETDNNSLFSIALIPTIIILLIVVLAGVYLLNCRRQKKQ